MNHSAAGPTAQQIRRREHPGGALEIGARRAPSAGAMMMYSIVSIREQATLDRLADLAEGRTKAVEPIVAALMRAFTSS